MSTTSPWTAREYGLLKRAVRLYENQWSLMIQCEPELAERGYDSCRSAARRLDDTVEEVVDLRIDRAPFEVFEQVSSIADNPLSRVSIPEVLVPEDYAKVYDVEGGKKDVKYIGRHAFTEEQVRERAGLSREAWECVYFKVNDWQQAAKDDANPGQMIVTTMYQTDARFKPRPEYDFLEDYKEGILELIAERAPNYGKAPFLTRKPLKDKHMLELAPYDLHISKLGWGAEVDDDSFDSKFAKKLVVDGVEDAIAKTSGFHIDHIVLPLGNDLFHTDTPEGTTTAGTRQDSDSRPGKMHARAEALMIEIIDRLMTIAPVEVLIVPGNHDQQNAFWLGRVLSAWYRNTNRVMVDTSPTLRKYKRYGTSLIGFTHGQEEKMQSLPLIMARERRQDWAEATQFEFHIGHFHKKKEVVYTAADEFNGVRIRVLPSLTGTDFWHYKKGYVKSWRAMESYLWNYNTGYVGHFSSNVLQADSLEGIKIG